VRVPVQGTASERSFIEMDRTEVEMNIYFRTPIWSGTDFPDTSDWQPTVRVTVVLYWFRLQTEFRLIRELSALLKS